MYIMQIIRKSLSRKRIYFSHSENGPNSWGDCQEIISFYTHTVILFLSGIAELAKSILQLKW